MTVLWIVGALFTLGFVKNEYMLPNKADAALLFFTHIILCIWLWPFVLGMYIREAVS